ncbi:MAG: hypothetical protein HY547_02425 [Elusimicrobia bacterium]|nr:hypothetical protein [Elusimicrobiota bacterium]
MGVSVSTDVYSPGDIYLTSIKRQYNSESVPSDFKVTFSNCREFEGFFDHVQSFSNAVLNQIGSLPPSDCFSAPATCSIRVTAALSAGDIIGTAGQAQNLDFGAYDARISPLGIANPSDYTAQPSGFDVLHATCPLAYFPSSVIDQNSLFGAGSGAPPYRTALPLCGVIGQDVANTAQGNWFALGGAPSSVGGVALVHDNVIPSTGAFSLTTVTGLSSNKVYWFAPAGSGLVNRDFNQVTNDGNVYCYDFLLNPPNQGGGLVANTIILLRMTSASALTLEGQSAAACGAGPWAFTVNASRFER